MSILMVVSGPIHRFHIPLSGRALRICDRAECFCRFNTFIYSMHANYDGFWYFESRCYQNQIVDCLGIYKSEDGILAVANLMPTMRFHKIVHRNSPAE